MNNFVIIYVILIVMNTSQAKHDSSEHLATHWKYRSQEFRCYQVKIDESEKASTTVAGSQTQDTSGLSYQCSATEPRQPDNQPLLCTAQVVLNASVAHLADMYVLSEFH